MISMMIALAIGIVAGILSGFFGIGGGIIIVPSLVFLFKYSQTTASGTSLVALLAPVGILGVMQYFKEGKIGADQLKMGMLIALGLFLGAYVGSKLALSSPDALIKKAFSVFLVLVAIKIWFS